MIPIDAFTKRLEKIFEYYSLNASSFADKIGVQRSSISHLLSARNKPSLDFILKVLEVFPEVDLYWLLNGKGSFPKLEKSETYSHIPPTETEISSKAASKTAPSMELFSENDSDVPVTHNNPVQPPIVSTESEIEQIVIFYKNGTCKIYKP